MPSRTPACAERRAVLPDDVRQQGIVVEPTRYAHGGDAGCVAGPDRNGARTKAVVWAHNSHLGDARATEMGDAGEVNIGQLAREQYGDDVVLVGFSTYRGTVTAASNWGSAGSA